MGVKGWLWNRMYRGTPTWELGQPDPELIRALDDRGVRGPGRAVDVGCGTGDNAIALAQRGFEVTALDIAERPLEQARAKAAAAGVSVEFRIADVTRLGGVEEAFDLIVDRGLLMSLFGERARRAYASALVRLAAAGGSAYQYQWVLPEPPRALSAVGLVARTRGVVLVPDELEHRLGHAFSVEVLSRSVEPADDPGIRRMGIRQVAKTSYWLTRRTDEHAP